MRRVRDVPKRHALKLLAVVVLGAGTAIAALLGHPELATALIGVLLATIAVVIVRLGPRVAQQIRTQTLENRKLANRIETAQRQTLTAVENERAVLAKLDNRLNTSLSTQRQLLASLERQLVSAVEDERRSGAERQHELLAGFKQTQNKIEESARPLSSLGSKITAVSDKITSVQRHFDAKLVTLRWEVVRENEALLQLFERFDPRAPMPTSGGWALSPTGLLELLTLIDRRQPRVLLELGSGTSTIWIAYALEKTGGRLISIDHDEEYAARTRLMLQMHGLDHVAEVRVAPLSPLDVAGESYNWYGVGAFEDVEEVDLLLVDGPPAAVGPNSRYPALHAIAPKLAARSLVLLDDVERADEQEIARRWAEEFPGLTRETSLFNRQAIFTYTPPQSSE
ncbi:hypothetical protein Pmi06nite_44590 [Planotetraspora mira]|uniref:Uncharacterized protein n=1 Tax=Planotetraspora mira TaxID=58121 RepID=A0A8J3TTE1_9ACTN|nr:hypothetical protein Pmi06nite_44590 [Planotetraspora mira]